MDKDLDELLYNPKEGMKQPRNVIYLDSYERLFEFLSPKKLDLLMHLMNLKKKGRQQSVGKIAIELKRHQEAISRDLQHLKNLKIVKLRKSGQSVFAEPEFVNISIQASGE